MGLDLYVGTLSRYWRRDWETTTQRWGREQGLPVNTIRLGPDGEPVVDHSASTVSADEAREAIRGWWSSMSTALTPHGCREVRWDESDNRPYFTRKPDWIGHFALVTLATQAEHPTLPVPRRLPARLEENEAFRRSIAPDFKSRYRCIFEPQLWLPIEFPRVFACAAPASPEPVPVGSVFTLKQQLDELNRLAPELIERSKRGPDSASGGLLGKLLKRGNAQNASPTLEEVAPQAMKMYRELADKACEHRMPMVLDF